MRVCTVLVCYCNNELGEIVTEHLDLFDAPVIDSDSLYKEFVELFARLELPWDELPWTICWPSLWILGQ